MPEAILYIPICSFSALSISEYNINFLKTSAPTSEGHRRLKLAHPEIPQEEFFLRRC